MSQSETTVVLGTGAAGDPAHPEITHTSEDAAQVPSPTAPAHEPDEHDDVEDDE